MLEGEISEIHLIERLVELWHEQFTGAIRFENDGIIKIVYFKGGDILSASTNDRSDSIDEILMRAGKVSRDHVKQALARRKESETLGDALLNLGFITRKELTWARRVQVVGVIRSIEAWQGGSFTIVSDYLPKRDEGTLFPLPQVLIELTVTDPERQKYEQLLDGGRAVFARRPEFDETFRRLGLNEDADAIVEAVDGRATAAEVAETSGHDPFNVYRLLHALATLQLLERQAIPQESLDLSNDALDAAGVADAADLWNDPATDFSRIGREEPVQPVAPQFDFDEAEAAKEPTLEVAIDTSMIPPYPGGSPPETAARSAWDEPDEEEAPEPPVRMPAWDSPREMASVPMPASVEPATEADEEQWGFDEAQIETARRAGMPVETAEPRKGGAAPGKRGRFGLVAGLLSVLALALAGYGGYLYWQSRTESTAATPVASVPTPAAPAAATEPAVTTAAPAPAADVALPVAQETATAPAAVPPPAPAQAAPPPSGDRAAWEARAQEYLANPSGNFTVQIQILCDVGNLGNVVREGGSNVWFVPQPIGERSCFRVFWGRYATRPEAEQGLASIPAGLRDRSAAVKPVPGR